MYVCLCAVIYVRVVCACESSTCNECICACMYAMRVCM